MNNLPGGFSVEVDGVEVVLTGPGGSVEGNHVLSLEEAEALVDLLRSACVTARRRQLATADLDEQRSALERALRQQPGYIEALERDARDAIGCPIPADPLTRLRGAHAGPGPSLEEARAAERAAEAERGQRGYEIRDRRDSTEARPSVEAWLPDWQWPAVRAVEYAGGWLVLVDSEVAEVAGVRGVDMTGLDAINADESLKWVELLAALYVKASGK
jgi:multidrug resistance efflux pump